jgi:site-specific DNA recombinase
MLADLYLRKSSADGGKSVSQQDDETADALTDAGHTIGHRFTDDNRSASRYATKARANFAALLAHIRSGHCELLGVWEASRASRREFTFFELLEACRAAGTMIYVCTDDRAYDPRRRADWKALAQEAINAADYSAKISENTTRGKRQAAREGKPEGRQILGYVSTRDALGKVQGRAIVPDEALIIKRIARELLADPVDGPNCSAVARGLNADGLKTKKGNAFKQCDISAIARNPTYAGLRTYRPTAASGAPVQLSPGNWEPLIDPDDHRRLVGLLSDPARLKHRGVAPRWLLSGIARHGVPECAGVLRVSKISGAYRYRCAVCFGLSVKADSLEEFVTTLLLKRLSRPDALAAFRPRPDDAAVATAKQQLADLNGELAQWMHLAKVRKVSPASFAEFEADLLPQIDRADAAVKRLEAPTGTEDPDLDLVDVPAKWSGFSINTKRRYVRTLIDVRVSPAGARGRRFSAARLRESRWVGDDRTWGEIMPEFAADGA